MKAFPLNIKDSGRPYDYYHGMDLRDYFAAKAMQAIITNPPTFRGNKMNGETDVAIGSYVIADAMMKAREK
jgi:hypothetical protein